MTDWLVKAARQGVADAFARFGLQKHAAQVKEAIGRRQAERIHAALQRELASGNSQHARQFERVNRALNTTAVSQASPEDIYDRLVRSKGYYRDGTVNAPGLTDLDPTVYFGGREFKDHSFNQLLGNAHFDAEQKARELGLRISPSGLIPDHPDIKDAFSARMRRDLEYGRAPAVPAPAVSSSDVLQGELSEMLSPVPDHSKVKKTRANANRLDAELAQADKITTSGRHSPDSVVSLKPTDQLVPGEEYNLPGVHPGQVAWRGARPGANFGAGPRWLSPIGHVSASYAQRGPNDRLEAFDVSNMESVGPLTPHIAIDPRNLSEERLRQHTQNPVKSPAAIGRSPIYEQVVNAEELAKTAPITQYKRLSRRPFEFMLTRGKNLLRGEAPSALGTAAKALTRV